MTKKTVSLGQAATGEHKELKKRFFGTRLSTGKRLEVMADQPVTMDFNNTDVSALAGLEAQGFIVLSDPEEKPAKPAKPEKVMA